LSPLFIHMNRIRLEHRYTALAEVTARGFSPRDVRHIVLTHLDFDHAGGLEDFPEATVHVMEAEAEAARRREGFIARRRYRPEQWDGVKRWRFYERDGSRWFGFDAVRGLDGLPPEILMIPLPGHTWGHAGVAIDTGADWVLNAGDVYFNRHEMSPKGRHCPAGARAYQRLMAVDHDLHLENQDRVRELAADPRMGVAVFCSHDAVEFEALRGLSTRRNLQAEAVEGSGLGQDAAAAGGRIP
jgi:glyoxylase-like metal-dependent hydrolase (beta-lactamase superfamily II)